jgi:hypothetical protein
MCWGEVCLAATRMVASGVAARAASTCESTRSALVLAIAIARFFSIRKSPIRQPDYRLVQPSARFRCRDRKADSTIGPGEAGSILSRLRVRSQSPRASAVVFGADGGKRGPGAVSRGESLRDSGGDRVSASEVVSGRTVTRVRAPVDSCCADQPVREGDQNAPSIHGRPRDSPVTIARAMRCARRRGSGRSDLPRVARTRAAQASQLPPAEAA